MKWVRRVLFFVLFLFVLLNILSAFHAYKFTHFYNTNRKIKKPEQMNGWEKAATLITGIKYGKRKITVLPSVAYDTFSVHTEDGFTLRGWKLACNDTLKPRRAMIMFHGHGSNRSAILTEAEAFNRLNYCVYMIDFRAHGESEGNVCTIGYNETQDVKSVYSIVKQAYGDSIVLWGISMGASTIIKAVAEYPDVKPSKVILEMPFGSLYDAVKGRLRTMHLPEQPFSALLTFWGGAEHGFWAFDMDPGEYAKAIKCPALLQWGINDARVSAAETTEIYVNLGSKQKKLVKYSAAHESLIDNDPERWNQNVSAFLSK